MVYSTLSQRLGRCLLLLLLPLALSGCLRYDLTLRFDHHTHGTLEQTIALSERGAALASATLDPWLAQLQGRSQALGGQLRQTGATATLTVPFATPTDLGDRFRQLFAAVPETTSVSLPAPEAAHLALPGWGTVPYDLAIDETSWGLASRIHFVLNLDLRELPANGDRPADQPWADLRLHLQTPWGLEIAPAATPPLATTATGATWPLPPGSSTAIDVTFWLPNGIALGSLAIAGIGLLGYLLRHRLMGPPRPG